jgi:glycosyltransferase involved in cell wall biosynthesis
LKRPSLLIVTRHYPPEISGGARRPFLIAQGLRARGYRVAVAAPFAPEGEPDWIRTPHPAAARAQAMRTQDGDFREAAWKPWVRRMVRWPDNEIGWATGAAQAVLASGLVPDWVLSTSPPESAHAAGERISRALGARWILEMRDSWLDEPLRPELARPGLRRPIERGLAQRWLSAADARIAVSSALAEEMRRLAPASTSRLSVIGHFADPPPTAFCYDGNGPNFLHAGSFTLSHGARRLKDLLNDFATVLKDVPGARLHLAGRLTMAEQAELALYSHASSVIMHGEVPYTVSRAMQAGADGLIVFQQGIDALPGKLAEYLESSGPILTVGEGSWKERMAAFPHWPLISAAAALAAPRRIPASSLPKALDAYEVLIKG